jgi:integrase
MADGQEAKKKNPRGLFERPAGSGVWWINYYVKGKQHRERVGRKSDAIKVYRDRKADATMGRKLPQLRASKAVLFGDLLDDVLEFTATHKDARSYITKAKIVREGFGDTEVTEMNPQGIERWLRKRCKTAATWNRYRAFFSLCFRRAMKHGKAALNPARDVDHRKEPTGRKRFLSREEYAKLHEVISRRFPEHLPEFVVSVKTGMRLSEQYTVKWSQVDLENRTIVLTNTKNGSDRTVDLIDEVVGAIRSVRLPDAKGRDFVFPRQGATYDTRSWFHPCLEEAQISGYTWHGNRHTFCSWLAQAGATTLDIMHAAGHRTPAMAARYSHLSPKHRASVVHLLA